MNNDLVRIKKLYGEDFAKKFCRPYFSHIIEREDFSFADYLTTIIAPSKGFYDDLIKNNKLELFKRAIWGVFNDKKTDNQDVKETPEELMKKVGYRLYKCETYEDMLKFKNYYSHGEEICTYEDLQRINTHTIFWAVKDNVDKIKREDFKNPERQDEYGTSVISLQFTKGLESTLSIINRYNLSVKYGDATFSNNLEKICVGLTASFKKFYGITLVKGRQKFELPGYVVDKKGTYYKCNCKINGTYYCANNIVIKDGVAKQFKPEQYIIADCYVFERKNKTVEVLSNNKQDSFVNQFYDIKKIEVEVDDKNKIIRVYCGEDEPIEIITNQSGQIISLINNNIKSIDDGFMCYCEAVERLSLSSVEYIGDDFLMENKTLKDLRVPKLKIIGNRALFSNLAMQTLALTNVREIGDYFVTSNEVLNEFYASKLENVGNDFLFKNKGILKLVLPKIKAIEAGFMRNNDKIERFYAPLLDIEKYGKYLNLKLKGLKKDNIITKLMQKATNFKEDIYDLF